MATATKRKASGKDFDDVPTSGYGDKSRKPTEQVQMLNTPDGKWTLFRPIGPAYSYAGHWITVTKKDGKISQFYMACAAWDPESVQRQGGNGAEHCKFCALEAFYKENDTPRDDRKSRFTVDHYANVISRVEQKRKPEDAYISEDEAATGFKTLDSDSWTPVRVVRMTDNVVRKVKGIRELNVHEDPETGDSQTYPASHKKFGCDIQLKYTAKNPPATRYETNRGNPTPLKKSEAAYLIWDLSDLTDYPTTAEMAAEFDSWAARNHVVIPGLTKKVAGKGKPAPVDDEDSEDEDEVPKAKAKRKPAPVADEFDDDGEDEAPAPKAKAKKKPAVVEDDDEFGNDDDEDEAPPPKAKKPAPKRQAEPEDDFEDDDDTPPPKAKAKPASKKPAPVEDDDDDFEDDTPAPPKAKKPAAKKPPVVEDDDDFEEEDAPPPKAKAKPGKKPPVVEDDDDDFEDDTPTPPKAKKPAAAPAKKKPAPVEDDDFEEEDEPPARKPAAKAKPAAVAAKKKPRPPVDDDDEFED